MFHRYHSRSSLFKYLDRVWDNLRCCDTTTIKLFDRRIWASLAADRIQGMLLISKYHFATESIKCIAERHWNTLHALIDEAAELGIDWFNMKIIFRHMGSIITITRTVSRPSYLFNNGESFTEKDSIAMKKCLTSDDLQTHCTQKETWFDIYRKISNISRTKSQILNVSRLVLQLSLPDLLKPCVKLRMKM